MMAGYIRSRGQVLISRSQIRKSLQRIWDRPLDILGLGRAEKFSLQEFFLVGSFVGIFFHSRHCARIFLKGFKE